MGTWAKRRRRLLAGHGLASTTVLLALHPGAGQSDAAGGGASAIKWDVPGPTLGAGTKRSNSSMCTRRDPLSPTPPPARSTTPSDSAPPSSSSLLPVAASISAPFPLLGWVGLRCTWQHGTQDSGTGGAKLSTLSSLLWLCQAAGTQQYPSSNSHGRDSQPVPTGARGAGCDGWGAHTSQNYLATGSVVSSARETRATPFSRRHRPRPIAVRATGTIIMDTVHNNRCAVTLLWL